MATVIDVPSLMTPEEFLKLPDRRFYELVDGQLVETNMSLEACCVAGQFIHYLIAYVNQHGLGHVFTSEATYRCYPDAPDKVRRPDVSFIARGRLSREQFAEGHCLISPDLVVEVISPNDLFYDVEAKVQEYRSAGVRLIWVASPRSRSVTVHRLDGSEDHFGEESQLSGEDVLPGFQMRVAEFFPQKDAAL
ncbi:MAG: Uma2 family endonuclease [Planctomycetaceae bacterium]|nr:Uma2 family endonuclease [Planctomycetaceae bacterium]